MNLVEIEPADTVRRDRWGRYVVVPPGGDKPTGYQRATTLAKMLEDTSNLTKWSARMTLLGAAQRPDIIASVLAADPTDRKTLDRLAEQAKEHGGANVRRDLGTAVHKFLELAHANPDYRVPEPYTADIAAIRTVLDQHGFDVVADYSERILVVDTIQVAGMCDLVLCDRSTGIHHVADLKTGASVLYGALGWATQLSIYSMADNIYEQGAAKDGSDDRRIPAPDVDRDTAYIIHCEPGSGSAQLHRLTIGAQFVEQAVAVREIRKRRDLLTLIEGGGTTSHTEPRQGAAREQVVGSVEEPATAAALDTRTAWLMRRIYADIDVLSIRHVKLAWPVDIAMPAAVKAGTDAWTDDDIDLICHALDGLEKHQAFVDHAFGDEDPKVTARRRAELEARLAADLAPKPQPEPEVEVDGPYASPDDVRMIDAVISAIRDGDNQVARQRLAMVQHWQTQGTKAKVPWKIGNYPKDQVPLRLWTIVMAAIGCIDLIDLDAATPDQRVRDALGAVTGNHDLAQKPSSAVGAMFGLLTIEQAEALAALAEGTINSKGQQQ